MSQIITSMTTLTIKINQRTKAGKSFMALVESFSKEGDGVEIISDKKNIYNPEFVKMVKEAEANPVRIKVDPKNVWQSLK